MYLPSLLYLLFQVCVFFGMPSLHFLILVIFLLVFGSYLINHSNNIHLTLKVVLINIDCSTCLRMYAELCLAKHTLEAAFLFFSLATWLLESFQKICCQGIDLQWLRGGRNYLCEHAYSSKSLISNYSVIAFSLR